MHSQIYQIYAGSIIDYWLIIIIIIQNLEARQNCQEVNLESE